MALKEEIQKYGIDCFVGYSGGKDSTAACLHLKEHEIPFTPVFANTGWEHEQTYEYIQEIEQIIGPVHMVQNEIEVEEKHRDFVDTIEKQLGFISPFVRIAIHFLCIPNGFNRFCTKYTKLDPIRDYILQQDDPVNIVGIRKEESKKRAKLSRWEWYDTNDCYTFRPLLDWTYQDVIEIHKRHNIKPNPLYLNGFDRVGCFPCVYARKAEIRQLTPKRLSIIRQIEQYISDKRNKPVSMFKNGTIDTVYEWSKTSRGGKQFFLFDTDEPSCMKWGLCDIATKENTWH